MDSIVEAKAAGMERVSINVGNTGDTDNPRLEGSSIVGSGSVAVTHDTPATAMTRDVQLLPPASNLPDQLVAVVERVSASKATPTMQELDELGAALKGALQEIEILQAWADQTTVERYYYCGLLIQAVARRVRDKKRLNQWLEAQVSRSSQLEVFRQMRKIASMGPEVLRHAPLGKNRVLELCYMLTEMEERNDGKLNAETFSRRLREIEQLHPFPAHPAMTQHDVDECKVHMDSIITQYRLEKALDVTDVCSFEDAKQVARIKKNSIERTTAEKVAQRLAPAPDKKAALKAWIDGGAKLETSKATGATTPERIADLLVEVNKAIAGLTVDSAALDKLRENPTVMKALNAAYPSFQYLHETLNRIS